MLQAIVRWSIHNRVIVLALALLLLAGGYYAARDARLDVFPEFAPPQVVIQTEAPGLSAPEVEQLVTLPIEYAINGLPRLDVLRSQSIQGLSVITVFFQDRTDVYRARQMVSERLGELAGQLPAGVRAPKLAPLTSTTGRLLTVGFTARPVETPGRLAALAIQPTAGLGGLSWVGFFLTGQKYLPQPNQLELRDVAQWTVRPRLLAVRGVAQVTIYGGGLRQLQVRVRPERLARNGLTLTDVLDAARQATGVRGGGFLENDRQRLVLRVEGQVFDAAGLGETVVATTGGTPVLLKDVAEVVEGPEPKFGDAAINGGPGVLLAIYKQFDGDTLEVTRAVEAELERIQPLLKARGVVYHPALFRQANFIEHAVGNVTESLWIGSILVCVVLFVFLFNVRTAFISLTAIPLSLLSAIVVLWWSGVGLNTLTLGGLAIAVGEVVDDAIIDVENIYRRLRENALLPQPRSAPSVVLDASLEVRTAVVYATFVVVLVFVPVFFLSGLQGRLFAPLGYAYVLAVLASLATALTVTPALSLVLLARNGAIATPEAARHTTPLLLRYLQAGYDRLLRLLDRDAALVAGVSVAAIALAVVALLDFGGNFLPELRESHYVVHVQAAPGTSLPQTIALGNRMTDALLRVDGVRTVAQQAGRAELGEDTQGVEYSEFEVDLVRAKAAEARRAQATLRQTTQTFPGVSTEVLPFLTERIKETLSGSSGAVAVKLYGDDLEALDQAALDVARALASVPGSQDVLVEPQSGAPELVVRRRPSDLARFRLRNADLLDAIHAAFQGAELTQVYKDNRVLDLVVILEPSARARPEQVADLWIALPPGDAGPDASAVQRDPATGRGRVQLKQVADVYLGDGRFLLAHEKGLRRALVSCNFVREGKNARDLTSFVAEAERAVGKVRLPPGVTFELEGEHLARRALVRELMLMGPAAGVGIVLLLWVAFGSVRRLLLVLVNVPFALVGGVVAVYLTGGKLDVGALIGFVTLFGITMRNGMMMVAHWQHLHEVEGEPWGPELVYRGARERLAPVLMTALVTALGLLPIALGGGEAGREIEGPMALVILGGLVTSTALNLLVLPVLYRRWGQPTAV
jgi:CzcA family heavy metal efflux pump